MKIKTELLQKMVAKAVQGASNNKMIFLTSLIGIEVDRKAIDENSELTLISADGGNQLRISNRIESEPNENSKFYSNNQFINFYTIVNEETIYYLQEMVIIN